MNTQTREIAYKALCFVQTLAPTGTIQQHFANIYNNMIMKGEEDSEVIKELVRALHDGLEYGNWP